MFISNNKALSVIVFSLLGQDARASLLVRVSKTKSSILFQLQHTEILTQKSISFYSHVGLKIAAQSVLSIQKEGLTIHLLKQEFFQVQQTTKLLFRLLTLLTLMKVVLQLWLKHRTALVILLIIKIRTLAANLLSIR